MNHKATTIHIPYQGRVVTGMLIFLSRGSRYSLPEGPVPVLLHYLAHIVSSSTPLRCFQYYHLNHTPPIPQAIHSLLLSPSATRK